MAIASGGSRISVESGLKQVGLYDYFDAIITSDDVQNGKPHPEGFLLAAKNIGVEPQDCVGYEDAVLGMQAIKSAGFLACIDVTQFEGYPKLNV